jgi:hypothetical protein
MRMKCHTRGCETAISAVQLVLPLGTALEYSHDLRILSCAIDYVDLLRVSHGKRVKYGMSLPLLFAFTISQIHNTRRFGSFLTVPQFPFSLLASHTTPVPSTAVAASGQFNCLPMSPFATASDFRRLSNQLAREPSPQAWLSS